MKNIKDAIWGFVVGDALGAPYEFFTREMMRECPAVDMVGYGTFNQPPGTWTDDTSMMLCVLENILNGGSSKDLGNLFLKWYKENYLTPYGELFDIGLTTRRALDDLILGMNPFKSGPQDKLSAGNGSLMRCLPYAFVEDLPKSIFDMLMHNKITHRNHLCSWSCIFYVKMLRSIMEGIDKQQSQEAAASYLRFGWRITDDSDDQNEEIQSFSRLLHGNLSLLSESEIKSTGYVISTLEAAIWCFLNADNYKDSVLKAVNLGGDTDTIAALTGGLAGLYYGKHNIPSDWMVKLASPNIINGILDRVNGKYIC